MSVTYSASPQVPDSHLSKLLFRRVSACVGNCLFTLFADKKRGDFYHLEELAALSQCYPHLQVTRTLSDTGGTGWSGARQLLPTVASHGQWRDHEVYLCGNPGMIEAAIDLRLFHGVPHEHIHFDAFAPNG
nr:hypothetical protein [Acidithiobacillus ferrooxidans]